VAGYDSVANPLERQWLSCGLALETGSGITNFRVDQLLELGASASTPAPVTLVLRARKEGS